MVVMIAYSVLCPGILFFYPEFIGQDVWNDPEFHNAADRKIFSVFRIVMVIFSLAFALLWSWILMRLMSAKVKREFVVDRSLSDDINEAFRNQQKTMQDYTARDDNFTNF